MGTAAFFAPEMATSTFLGARRLRSQASLNYRAAPGLRPPFFRCECFHRKRGMSHACAAERGIDQLVLAHLDLSRKSGHDDDRLEMPPPSSFTSTLVSTRAPSIAAFDGVWSAYDELRVPCAWRPV